MSLPQFIRDNTNDGHDIAALLIDVMNGRIDGSGLTHRLTAARLLTIYGHEDADDFIVDNTSHSSDEDERGSGKWVIIDPDLTRLIRFKTDDGRAMCLFLIDVMEGKVEGIHVGHRVSAAKELLNRAFGKSRSGPLPKPPGSTAPKRSTHKTHQRVAPASVRPEPVEGRSVPPTQTAVLDEPEQQPEPEANRGVVIDIYNDPRLSILDSELYDFMSICEAPDFDPYQAAIDEDYFNSYTGCKDPECEVHSELLGIDFDPNDFHY